MAEELLTKSKLEEAARLIEAGKGTYHSEDETILYTALLAEVSRSRTRTHDLKLEVERLRTENATAYTEIKELRKALGILSPSEELRKYYEGKPSVFDGGMNE